MKLSTLNAAPQQSWWNKPMGNQYVVGQSPAEIAIDTVSLSTSNTVIAATTGAVAALCPSLLSKVGVCAAGAVAGYIGGMFVAPTVSYGLDRLSGKHTSSFDSIFGQMWAGGVLGAVSGLGGAVAGSFGVSPTAIGAGTAASSMALTLGLALKD